LHEEGSPVTDQEGPSEPEFRPSSFSGGGDCVEVKQVPNDGPVAVRHSKQRAQPALVFTPTEWDAFIRGVKAGEFDPV